MTPTPQETAVLENTKPIPVKRPLSGDEVVITGMSGIFPNSDSVQEFNDNLYNKVDMVTADNPRWVFNHPEVPKHLGKVNGMGKFDAQFFRVHYKQACTMEPMSRKLLEHAYSAIYDSGMNPLLLRGRKVGVFIGSTFSESEKIVIYENIQRNGFGITGCNKAMYANRISYWIDGKGPSYALDVACASSSACLEDAYRSISSGHCDAAIVGGCNLCMHPSVSLHCRRAGFLCLDGKTKCFDKHGDGFVRGDAISVLFLQRAKDAKRIYSEVYYAKSVYSPLTSHLLPVRDPKDLQQFFEDFYSEIDVSPEDVEYIEGSGAAFPEADSSELIAVAKVFAKKKPIKIGCVKSNMGSSQPASGVCGITKMCLAYQNGKLPGNLHYDDPLDIPEVGNDKVQVLTENTSFSRGFTAMNTFSYSGVNVHILLKGYNKLKDPEKYKSSIPRLVLISGRQENCVNKILDSLKQTAIDPEQIGLLHSVHESDIPGHMSRGYTILDTNEKKETVCVSQSVEYFPGTSRPVWFVYSGMGSQWATMGAQLMRIPIFAAAIHKCHNVLEPKGIDIIKILTENDKSIYDNILHSFVGIAAVQIGLTDILKELGIVPDNIIGHSVGELGCAYADGCFTAEEMILSAYSRGLVSLQTDFIRGSMAAVGLGYKDVLPMCPSEIEVACHNSSESATISGPADVMKLFVSDLTSKGIFAKEVPCSNIAYHSRYISEAGPGLLKFLKEVIKDPKARTKKWVSTSVPQDKWDDDLAKYSSAEYHTNNLLNSVLFEETSKLIPSDALVIEIAPHGLLQAILKRSLGECVHVPLTKRGTADPVNFLLDAIGKLYQAGLHPKVDVLYPKIEYPVSTGTPLLSQFVEWEHSEDWPQAKYNNKDRKMAKLRDFVMSIHDDDYKYFEGHIRDGNCVFPESAFLVLVWETLAMHEGVPYEELSVIFENVQFHGEAFINSELPVRLQIMIMKGNNKFEITYENATIVSGFIFPTKATERVYRDLKQNECNTDSVTLTVKDIYAMLNLKGHNYKGEFQSIRSASSNKDKASVKWTNNWITLLDSLIQLNTLVRPHKGASSLSIIKNLRIDIKRHNTEIPNSIDGINYLNAEYYSIHDHTRCGGVEIDGLIFNDKPVVEQKPDVLLMHTFVPYIVTGIIPVKTALQVNFQVVSENVTSDKVHVTNHITKETSNIMNLINEVATGIPTHDFNIQTIKDINNNDLIQESIEKTDFVIIDNLLGNEKKINEIYNLVPNKTFILTIEQDNARISDQFKQFSVITAMSVQNQILILLRKNKSNLDENIIYMPIAHNKTFTWVSQLQIELQKSRKIILVSERQPHCGLLGMVKKLRQKHGDKIGLLVVDDYHVPSFNPEKAIFKDQLEKNLAINIFNKGQWGGYYNISSTKPTKVENVQLTTTIPGDLESLSWIETPIASNAKNIIQVCYAGPSYGDLQVIASNTDSKHPIFGMDFSGINERDEKVMGLVSGGAIASTVEADPDFLWPVPSHWTLEDAATVPMPYVYAYYCLFNRCELKRGRTVFVNGGAKAFGQAVIALSLDMGCVVYTTVTDDKQKQVLLNMFPELNENNIHYSPQILKCRMARDPKIKNGTKGADIVINCYNGIDRTAAMKCVGIYGYFLDTSESDMMNNEAFEMNFLFNATNYQAVKLSTIFKPEYAKEKKLLQLKLAEGISKGTVRPLSRVLYSSSDVIRTYRFLSSEKDTSKVLIQMQNESLDNPMLNVTSRMSYDAKASYMVVSDGSQLAVELCERLVRRGVKHLLVHLDTTDVDGYCLTKFKSWKELGVCIKISSVNLHSEKGCANLVAEGAKLGAIRGLFLVHSSNRRTQSFAPEHVVEKFNISTTVVANLDLISRTCSELEHFVVINHLSQNPVDEYISSAIEKICHLRNNIGLPATVFRTGAIKELDYTENIYSKVQEQPISAVLNALDTTLKMKHNNVITFDLKKNYDSEFLEKISKILGVKNILYLDENLSLKDLLQNEHSLEEVNEVLKRTYKISYPMSKLETLAIKNIKHLRRVSGIVEDGNTGLGAFFTFIDEDECTASEPVVTMATSYSSVKEEEELDPKATYVMLVPGFEGHHRVFTNVCERLKVQALTLQLEPSVDNDSIPLMAANLAKFIKNRLELRSKFYLLGYSFGVNIALEIARILEKDGHVGIVYCLDSSPAALRAILQTHGAAHTDTQLQNNLILHMYTLMTDKHPALLQRELETKHTWDDKVELCVNKLRGLVKYSHQYQKSILHSAYNRIILARQYEPDFVLNSELVLIKGVPCGNMKELPEDYGLSKYTNKPVRICPIRASHAAAAQDCRVSNIVNSLLEPKLLEEFKNKNLCWSYLADPVKTY